MEFPETTEVHLAENPAGTNLSVGRVAVFVVPVIPMPQTELTAARGYTGHTELAPWPVQHPRARWMPTASGGPTQEAEETRDILAVVVAVVVVAAVLIKTIPALEFQDTRWR